ncbi:STAS domain-containing protein [Thalassospira lucentensis]|uniref:STAS domain-containing protein n=1 Tax=Thalassospira lucentensis TaxID=168935 RepID=UPI00142DD3CE|nr:STAS domain-containing protein [Thalassospira lucentensis]NIZ03795.1 STAS domain-containing protein [Thalassospira lucentensis]
MAVENKSDGDIQIIVMTGRLDSSSAGEAESNVKRVLDLGATKLLVDMSDLAYISSAGLRVVLIAAKSLHKAGGAMAICGMSPSVREVFEMTGFLKILQVFDTETEAKAALA